MKNLYILILIIITLYSCSSNEKKELIIDGDIDPVEHIDSISIVLTKCDCIDPLETNKEWCQSNYKTDFTIQEQFECTGDSSLLDTIPEIVKGSLRNDYENDLTLEIKEIEEEKEDPISEDCKLFLEDYAGAIKDFKHLVDKIEKNPTDISLKIAYSSQSDDMESWTSKPQMFQCSQTESFKTQVEILNTKKDKLLEN